MEKDYPPTDLDEQIDILKHRKMSFKNEERARKYIRYIGYQRLSWYWSLFYASKEKGKELFREGLTFEEILSVYIFDRKLRMLFLEASERIELCLKTLLSDIMSVKTKSSNWYLDARFFDTKVDHYYKKGEKQKEKINHGTLMSAIDEELKRNKIKETTLKSFNSVYNTKIHSWDLFQNITFGKFSRFVELINGDEAKDFYNLFSLPKAVFDNWIECIVTVRNICAHYKLFCFRSFSNKPKSLLHSKKRTSEIIFNSSSNDKFWAQFYIFSYFMHKISPTSSWVRRVTNEIQKASKETELISFSALGFPIDWQKIFSEYLPKKNNNFSKHRRFSSYDPCQMYSRTPRKKWGTVFYDRCRRART